MERGMFVSCPMTWSGVIAAVQLRLIMQSHWRNRVRENRDQEVLNITYGYFGEALIPLRDWHLGRGLFLNLGLMPSLRWRLKVNGGVGEALFLRSVHKHGGKGEEVLVSSCPRPSNGWKRSGRGSLKKKGGFGVRVLVLRTVAGGARGLWGLLSVWGLWLSVPWVGRCVVAWKG